MVWVLDLWDGLKKGMDQSICYKAKTVLSSRERPRASGVGEWIIQRRGLTWDEAASNSIV